MEVGPTQQIEHSIAEPIIQGGADNIPPVPRTLTELLQHLGQRGVRNLAALRSKAALLSEFLNKPVDEITIVDIEEAKARFRPFLVQRRLKENSVKTYQNEIAFLIKFARTLGWKPDEAIPEVWRPLMDHCKKVRARQLCKFLMGKRKHPSQIVEEDVDQWMATWVIGGGAYRTAKVQSARLWKALVTCGLREDVPAAIMQCEEYGIRVEDFPNDLKAQVEEILRWKQASWAKGRPRDGRHRPITAGNLRQAFCVLYGFAITVLGDLQINSISQLFTPDIAFQYIDWGINVRKLRGQTVRSRLALIGAALRHHPNHRDLDLSWLKGCLDGIPTDSKAELREKHLAKQVHYDVVEGIPPKIHAGRRLAAHRGKLSLALTVRDELLMKWLTILPWRSRNIRECRLEGSRPNVFKGPIERSSMMAKFDWVEQELKQNPSAEFWQFRFSVEETKIGNSVRALIPSDLIELLEEYVAEYRPFIVRDTGCDLLFPNDAGGMMYPNGLEFLVGEMTLRYGGKALTPHTFRHIVAYAWLENRPNDCLTLSKHLWHTNIQTTMNSYAVRYDESNGVCGMEEWMRSRRK